MFNWFRKKVITQKTQIGREDLSCIGEPIISFVRVVKENPKRFKVRSVPLNAYKGTHYSWMEDHNNPVYEITDKQESLTFQILCSSGRIYSVYGVDFSINGFEMRYLLEQLHGIFTKSAERKERIQAMKDKRYWNEVDLVDKVKREAWKKIYS